MVVNDYSSDDKVRWSQESPKNPSRTDFERDLARLLHSSALRRLGAKTQVFGPESNDFIRTRLTHSLEVAQIGRSLAKNLGADPDIVETACLAHDIGHPPFGHNGESALNEVAKDIGGFEGNAQTLRVLTRLEPKRFHPDGSPAGLNLTRACLDATIKYPWARYDGPQGEGSEKHGVYADDLSAFEWAHQDHGEARCAEAQMMDLADDIAYSVHDLEDTIVRGAMPPEELATNPDALAGVVQSALDWYGGYSRDELHAAALRLMQVKSWPTSFSDTLRDLAQVKDLTSDLIGRFIGAVTRATRERHGDAPLVRYTGDVVLPRETGAEIVFLKGVAAHYVMTPRSSEPVFFEQRTVLFDLVDAIVEDPDRLERPYRDLWQEATNDDARLRVAVDQVASLTDQSARAWHAQYCGFLRN